MAMEALNILTMKSLILSIKEFLQFRQVAEKYRIEFTHGSVRQGQVEVRASANDLALIGY